MILIDQELLNKLSNEAQNSSRKRKNFNFHTNFSDPINRMLNAFEPGTYVQPHKHENPDKREVFIVLRGSIAVFFFDDSGKVVEKLTINPKSGSYGIEVEPRRWHSLVSLEPGTVVYEFKDGPFNPDTDKFMASWAPEEGNAKAGQYLVDLLNEL